MLNMKYIYTLRKNQGLFLHHVKPHIEGLHKNLGLLWFAPQIPLFLECRGSKALFYTFNFASIKMLHMVWKATRPP